MFVKGRPSSAKPNNQFRFVSPVTRELALAFPRLFFVINRSAIFVYAKGADEAPAITYRRRSDGTWETGDHRFARPKHALNHAEALIRLGRV